MQVHVTKRPLPWATCSLTLQHLPHTGVGASAETRSGVTRETSKGQPGCKGLRSQPHWLGLPLRVHWPLGASCMKRHHKDRRLPARRNIPLCTKWEAVASVPPQGKMQLNHQSRTERQEVLESECEVLITWWRTSLSIETSWPAGSDFTPLTVQRVQIHREAGW